MNNNIEFGVIETKSFYFASIYIPPKALFENTLFILNEILSKLNSSKPLFLAGDFNINMLNDTPRSNDLYDLLLQYNLFPTTVNATRINQKSCTLLDNIFTNYKQLLKSGVITTDISDHLTPFVSINNSNKIQIKNKAITYRVMANANLKHFKQLLSRCDWYLPPEPNYAFKKFENNINSCLNISCPLTTKTLNKNNNKINAWMSKGLLKSRKQKNKLYNKWIKSKHQTLRVQYDNYAKLYYKLIKKCKALYWDHFYKNCANDVKLLWRATNVLLRRSKKQNRLILFQHSKQRSD